MAKAAPKEKPKSLIKMMAENRLRKNPFASLLTKKPGGEAVIVPKVAALAKQKK